MPSINSPSKNLLPFLLDLLTTIHPPKLPKTPVINKPTLQLPNGSMGSLSNVAPKPDTTGILHELLTKFYPVLIRILKEGFVTGIKAGLACGADFTIPGVSPVVRIKLSKIDFMDLLKIDPTSDVGSTFYGKDATKDFNWFLYNLVQSGGSATWKNVLDLTYLPATEEIEIRINSSFAGKKFDEFLLGFMGSIELVSQENLMTKLMNQLTGSLGANLPNINMSLDKLIALEKVNSLQDKINSSDPCKEEYKQDDSFFTFTNDELYDIENTANQKFLGTTNLDMGCGIVPSTVNPIVAKTIFDEIRNTPPSKVSVIIAQSITTLNNSLTANVPEESKKIAKLSLNTKLITDIPKIFTNIALEPKIVALYQISSQTVNNVSVDTNDGFDYAKATKVFFEYVTREALSALMKIIYDKVKEEVINLVAGIAIKIVKEQAKIRIKSIASIVTGNVDGILTTIKTSTTSDL
jgi:hypothetical protein